MVLPLEGLQNEDFVLGVSILHLKMNLLAFDYKCNFLNFNKFKKFDGNGLIKVKVTVGLGFFSIYHNTNC